MAPRNVFSWIQRRVRSGAADGMWLHLRLSDASRSALHSLCSPIQHLGSSLDFHDEFHIRCHERKKNAWSHNAHVGQRSQCGADTLVAATTHKRTFHQADVNMQRVFPEKSVSDFFKTIGNFSVILLRFHTQCCAFFAEWTCSSAS